MKDHYQVNQSLWDQKTPIHATSKFYNLEGFKRGEECLKSIELEALLPVKDKTLLHLQCHFGQDTLSWARKGAQVTGVDFSSKAIELARSLSAELQLPARFIQCNLYDLPQHLDEQFDIVFTSYGVIAWLEDLPAWAALIDQYLKPGGTFFIAEFHPYLYTLDFNSKELAYDYFHRSDPYKEMIQGTYAETGAALVHEEYFWTHSLADVASPLLSRGLQLVDFQEYDYSPYNCFPNLKERAAGEFVFDVPIRMPHVFSMKFRRV